MRIAHTMIRVADLERSLHFYTQVLGMELKWRRDFPEGRFTLAFVGFERRQPVGGGADGSQRVGGRDPVPVGGCRRGGGNRVGPGLDVVHAGFLSADVVVRRRSPRPSGLAPPVPLRNVLTTGLEGYSPSDREL